MITFIIPTLNEMKHALLKDILTLLSSVDCEIIVVDSASTDGTRECVKSFPKVILLDSLTNSRAERMNIGAEAAKGSLIVFHHPRSILSSEGLTALTKLSPPCWGGFTHSFDHAHPLLKFTSWYSNRMRADISQIYYLDHCIFLSKCFWKEIGPIAEVDIFEDTLLSQMCKSKMRPVRLPHLSTTSAVRFKTNGVLRQSIMNQFLKIGFHLGIPHKKMNRIYEKGLGLNSKYKK